MEDKTRLGRVEKSARGLAGLAMALLILTLFLGAMEMTSLHHVMALSAVSSSIAAHLLLINLLLQRREVLSILMIVFSVLAILLLLLTVSLAWTSSRDIHIEVGLLAVIIACLIHWFGIKMIGREERE